VAIIGRGASGKSTLAVRLGEITGLPVIELDKIFWQPGLVATHRDHWTAIQERLVAEERWIMDGDLGHPTMLSRSGFVLRTRFFFWTSRSAAAPGEQFGDRASVATSGNGS
jgi:cytidylate kinase